jgi:hypothetical protein
MHEVQKNKALLSSNSIIQLTKEYKPYKKGCVNSGYENGNKSSLSTSNDQSHKKSFSNISYLQT